MSAKNIYAVVGTGAIGGFYGAKLCRAGRDVHFLLRSDFEHVLAQGLYVKSPTGDISLPQVNAYASSVDMPRADIIIVAVKSFANPSLKSMIVPVLKPSSAVLLIQNGLGGEEVLSEFVPADRIFGGLAFICVSKERPGVVNHQDYGSIRIGAYEPNGVPLGVSQQLQEIVADFRDAGIEATPAPDLLLARWEKLAWNIPFSGLSVLLNADTRKIVSDPDSAALARLLIRDVSLAAKACGKLIQESFQRKMFDNTVTMVPYAPSIKLDYDAGRPMETESIFGNPLRTSQKAGYQAPYMEMVYRQMKFLENMR